MEIYSYKEAEIAPSVVGGQHTQVNITELVTISSLKQELWTHDPDGFLRCKIMYFN